MAAPSDLTWREIATCFLIGATLVSAYYQNIILVIAFGLVAAAMAMLSISESIRLATRHNEKMS
jgi:hypothetical protein